MITTSTGTQDQKVGQATLPRSAKLLKPFDFKRVFGKNVASSDRFFRIIARPSCSGESRLGMAVSRKVDKHAVGRNRIKRVVRESFRHRRAVMTEQGGPVLDIVVLARPDSATICKKQLFQSLDRHWLKLERLAEQKFTGTRQPEERQRWEI
jgi:ribonuclease P protein component